MEITGSIMIYMLEVTYMLPKFHHTDRLHIHAHKRCTTAQRHIFHTNCKYILDNRFNTTCPSLLHHHSQKHIKCDQHIQPTSQHVLLHHHCLLQHYSYNQKDGQHQECYIQIATHKTNIASHAFPVLANHFLQLV